MGLHSPWRLILFCTVAMMLCGCHSPRNLRAEMEQAVRPAEGIQQTGFVHIGEIQTPQGVFHVATQRLVLKGMLAPRGLPHRLLLFDNKPQLVARYDYAYDAAVPLWCQGSRIYLSGLGSFRGVTPDPRLIPEHSDVDEPFFPKGNVIDFSSGVMTPVLTREKRYGSSGGIEDDPWDRKR